MDRTFEEIRNAALDLDRESQRQLADEIENNLLDFEIGEDVYAEAHRRLEAYRRGDGNTLSEEESFARGKALIAQATSKK